MNLKRIIWIAIFILGVGVRSTELFHPVDTGLRRENDIQSISRNYYRNGMDFLHPQIDWCGVGPGYTESEFPVYPYLIALSYKLFGVHEPTGRIISFLFSIGAMLVFFRLSRYLFRPMTAIAVSFFFTLSPLLMVTSVSIQPESMMIFFYIFSAYAFIRWIESGSKKYYISTIIFTACALLCKITSINIGILFLLIIIITKGWRFLFKPKVILMGILSVLPSVIWYAYSHKFYTQYGNSLGLSNEYAWVGWDFFTNPAFVKGIIRQELSHVWTYSGPLIVFLALVTTKIIKNKSIIFPICWLSAVLIFYIIASRTTADAWAYYYHIFSIPLASMLLGISVTEIYDKYSPLMKLRSNHLIKDFILNKNGLVLSILAVLVFSYAAFCFKYLTQNKPIFFETYDYYACKDSLSELIPPGSLIVVTGGMCRDDDNYPLAYNKSYFFYWLDRKGFNICVENQSIENVLQYKENGADFYIAETQALQEKQGFEESLRKIFKSVFECNGLILFKL